MSKWSGFETDELRSLSEALNVATVQHEGSAEQHWLYLEVDGELARRETMAEQTEEVNQKAKEGSLVRTRDTIRPKYLQNLLLEVEEVRGGVLHCQVVDKPSLRGKRYQGGVICRCEQVILELA